MTIRVLIIEDDPALGEMLGLHFEDQGFAVVLAGQCRAGLDAAHEGTFDLVMLDQQLPDGLGIDLVPHLLAAQPNASLVMMTGQHDLELAIRAIALGASDFLHKPIKARALQATVEQVLARRDREPPSVDAQAPVGELIGRSDAMLEVSKQIALCAANMATVLIHGESGTGKEIIARLIHQHSQRKGAFVAVNCAAIVDSLLESELFGHEKGAFTGADRAKPGKFDLAADGTLFLDEIGELSPAVQAKLLRALQERTIERVGGTRGIAINARIIAATHRDLFALARAGDFREDLAYRLNVVTIELPPLRERLDDIPLLAVALLDKAARHNERPPPRLAQSALTVLQAHDWPGNVRELENTLTQAMILARDGQITDRHLRLRLRTSEAIASSAPGAARASADDGHVLRSLDEVEAEHIQRVLDHTGGHKGRTCDILGISRPALDRKIRKYALRLPAR
jgi:DNA-binding NtrC family response regulator